MHPRISVSAICTFAWSLDEDLAFWADTGISHVGVSVAKLERAGWADGVERVEAAGVRVGNLIGLGPFHLDDATQWTGPTWSRVPAEVLPNRRLALTSSIDAPGTYVGATNLPELVVSSNASRRGVVIGVIIAALTVALVLAAFLIARRRASAGDPPVTSPRG